MLSTLKYFLSRAYTIVSIVLFVLSYGALKVSAIYYPTDNITNPTCAPGDSGCYVSLLPDQTSNAGKFLTTNGTTTSWATVSGGISSFNTRTGAITLTSGDVTGALAYTPLNKTGDTMTGDLNLLNIQASTSSGINLKNIGGTTIFNVGSGSGVNATITAPLALTGALTQTGNADAVQLRVRGHSTQTSDLTQWVNSSGTVLNSISGAGNAVFGPSIAQVPKVGISTTNINQPLLVLKAPTSFASFLFFALDSSGVQVATIHNSGESIFKSITTRSSLNIESTGDATIFVGSPDGATSSIDFFSDGNANFKVLVEPSTDNFIIKDEETNTPWFNIDRANRRVSLGDINYENNGMSLNIDDFNKNFYLSSGGGQVFRFDANSQEIFFGNEPAERIPFYVNYGSMSFQLGDRNGILNETSFRGSDTDQRYYIQKAGNEFLDVDILNNKYKLGDINLANNGTRLVINDSARVINLGNNENDGPDGIEGLQIDLSNGGQPIIKLGSTGWNSGNGTLLTIDDYNMSTQITISGNRYFTVDTENRLYQLGDIDSSNNGTYLTINDNFGEVSIGKMGNFKVLKASISEFANISIGDVDNENNGTRISLDDESGDMVLEANGNIDLIGAALVTKTLNVGGVSVSGIVSRFANSTGTCDINPTTTSLSCSSDRTLKTNITNLNNTTLNQITSLKPVTYTWINDTTNQQQTGFIAQDVEQIFPSLVSTDPTTNLKSLNYIGLIPYTIEGIKELDIKVNKQALLFNNDQTRLDKIKVFFDNLFGENKMCIDDETCLTKQDVRTLLEIVKTHQQTPVIESVIKNIPNSENNVVDENSENPIDQNVIEEESNSTE